VRAGGKRGTPTHYRHLPQLEVPLWVFSPAVGLTDGSMLLQGGATLSDKEELVLRLNGQYPHDVGMAARGYARPPPRPFNPWSASKP
jgi:hypothetical protein